ncbi:hypothetical protein [Salinigranum rubrum]|nr:hypothetical protein [Salinigranum rubrum]
MRTTSTAVVVALLVFAPSLAPATPDAPTDHADQFTPVVSDRANDLTERR